MGVRDWGLHATVVEDVLADDVYLAGMPQADIEKLRLAARKVQGGSS